MTLKFHNHYWISIKRQTLKVILSLDSFTNSTLGTSFSTNVVSKRIITKTHFYSCHVKIVFWSSSFSKLMFISGCVKFCYYFICLFSRLSFMITFYVKMKSHLSYCGTNEDIWDTCSRSCDCFINFCLIRFWCKIKTWKNKHEGNLIPHSRLFKG